MDAAIAGIIGTCIGAIAGIGGSIATARSEERRHYRALGVQVATAKFEQHLAMAQKLANMKGDGEIVKIPPFESFLVYGIRLMEVVSDLNLTPDEIKTRIGVLAKSIAGDGDRK